MPAADSTTPSAGASPSSESAYHDLRRLIPSLASELDSLRTSLREHNLWLLRYGHSNSSDTPGASTSTPSNLNLDEPKLPTYTAPSAPSSSPPAPISPPSTRDDVRQRRDQIVEWLREGEEVLREYSARFAQLGEELHMPFEDVLGTWVESDADNALPDYERIEAREELMVGGVGEVPPPYVGGAERVEDKSAEKSG